MLYPESNIKYIVQVPVAPVFLRVVAPKSGLARDLGDRLQSRNVPFCTSRDSVFSVHLFIFRTVSLFNPLLRPVEQTM